MEKLEIAKVLEKLGKGELQSFKDKLSEIKLKKGYKHVSQHTLQEADASSLTELLISLYGMDYGEEVAAETLRAIHQGAVADRIAGQHFTAQQQRLDPWVMSSDFLPLLLPGTQNKPHQMITFERTDLEKMQMLYEPKLSWRRRYKRRFYSALKATNPALLEELEGGHFVERHREELIKRASLVDEVLALLYGDILDNEQYLEICTEPGKMRKLYKLVPNWDDERKDRLYQVLKETNRVLVKQLEGK
ncbi:apoptosis-associated speck-like protein containing a CARD [Emydura macquarii macquarii]|uniref:apoptosis-associated speck-like protein containing a CARD n=1 Tax=Emydura macquarii macquarii TaxID=1129001 RepID=UPI00352B66B5